MIRIKTTLMALTAALVMTAGLVSCASSDNVDVHGHVSVGVGVGYYGSPWYYGGGYYPPPPVAIPPPRPGYGPGGGRPDHRPSGPSARPLPSIPSSPRPSGGGMRRR